MRLNLTGQVFGRLTVIREGTGKTYKNGNKKRTWHVACSCGNEFEVLQQSLRSGHTKSCGCLQSEVVSKKAKELVIDIKGQRFNRLVAIKDTGKRDKRSAVWLCECDCGGYKEVSQRDLKTGNTTSCGCLPNEIIVKRNKHWGLEGRFIGDKSHKWNPKLTKEDRLMNRSVFRKPINDWRVKVFIRDKRTCAVCDYRGQEINAHHLDGWNWCKEKRFDLDNGITLCKECHRKFHNEYGYGDNTKEQFEDFKKLNAQGNYKE